MEIPKEIACTKCGEVKPLNGDYFIPNASYMYGFTRQCKVCLYAGNKVYRKENPESIKQTKQENYKENCERIKASTKRYREENAEIVNAKKRDQWLRVNFKKTPEWYEETLTAQGGHCALCDNLPSEGRRFQVDHDHGCCPTSGKLRKTCGECVRGLLCEPCNTDLGRLEAIMEQSTKFDIVPIPGTWLSNALAYLDQYKRADFQGAA